MKGQAVPSFIGRDTVQELVGNRDAIVAEVLPRSEYEWAHLPNALHLPLKGWDVQRVEAELDHERPVIVYCNDYQ